MAEVCKRTSLLVISPWIMVHLPRHMSPANPVPARVPPLLRDSAIGPPPCRNAAVGVSRSDNGGRRSECAGGGTIRETESDPGGVGRGSPPDQPFPKPHSAPVDVQLPLQPS